MTIQTTDSKIHINWKGAAEIILDCCIGLKTLAQLTNQKLSPCYYGPDEMIEKVRAAAYKSLRLEESLAQPVFHVSLWKERKTGKVKEVTLASDEASVHQ